MLPPALYLGGKELSQSLQADTGVASHQPYVGADVGVDVGVEVGVDVGAEAEAEAVPQPEVMPDREAEGDLESIHKEKKDGHDVPSVR